MSTVTPLWPALLQGTTAVYSSQLINEGDIPISGATLTSLTLTYTDQHTRTVLNGRLNQNALNANDVTIDSAGRLEWALQVADTVMVSTRRRLEAHTALFTFAWLDGSAIRVGGHEVQITIKRAT